MAGPSPETTEDRLRILVVRADRIGDVLLSTPVFEVIKRHYSRSRLSVMVREPVAPVIRGLESVDHVIIYDPLGRHKGLRGLLRLTWEIRARKFRIAVVLQSQWRIAMAIFLAGVRYRVGPLSKLYSFMFYNRGIRQRRSHVEMHESDYNLQLLRRIGIRVGTRNVGTSAHVHEETKLRARKWLMDQGHDPKTPMVVVHPGMGHSALNWPENHYIDFVKALLRDGRQILVTCGPEETSIAQRFAEAFADLPERANIKKPIVYLADGREQVDFLGALFGFASVVVAPSTGPLHLAVALGKPVVTFYSPIRVQSAIRWGPYLREPSKASILVPDVYCGEDFKCRGTLCNYFPCMKSLTVTLALEETNKQLAQIETQR